MQDILYAPWRDEYISNDKLEELDAETWLRMSTLSQEGVRLLKEGFGAHVVNIGMNLGAPAGAGIAEHVHMHLVPRFNRDTNFITSIGQNRVYSTDFDKIYQKIKSLIPDFIGY